MLTMSSELKKNRVRVKLDARMLRAPKKILYQEALRTGEENRREVFSKQRPRSEDAEAAEEFS
jgi:hypothetical protein